MFDEHTDFLGWEFDPEAEWSAALELAQTEPDLLILAAYQWNTYLTACKQRPRRFAADYFQMKRLVSKALAACYPAPQAQGVTGGDPLRVAIWVPFLPNNPNNNILRVVAGYLGGLCEREGIEAALVLTNEFSHPKGSTVPHARIDPRPYRATLENVIAEYDAPATSLYMAPPPFVDEGNFVWMRNFQAEFRPNAIFVPNFEMSSVHIEGFEKSAATVYLQTSVRNRPPYDFTRYLYLGAKRKIDDTHIHPDKWYYHSFGYGNFGTGANLTRVDIGLDDDAFVVVTAGNRLEREVDAEFIGIMANLMDANPKVVWMLMGVQDEAGIRHNLGARFEAMSDRVVCKGYVREIGDYLSLSDIYANPRRTGGAVSMALAVYGHTPVLSFYGNDACNFLIDEMIQDTAEAYGTKLAKLASDKTYLAKVEAEQLTRFETGHTVDASVADLEIHLKAARSDWSNK
jgi:hypothetical protein